MQTIFDDFTAISRDSRTHSPLSHPFRPPEYTQKLTESRSKAEGTVNFDTILNKNMSGNISAMNRCCDKKQKVKKEGKIIV